MSTKRTDKYEKSRRGRPFQAPRVWVRTAAPGVGRVNRAKQAKNFGSFSRAKEKMATTAALSQGKEKRAISSRLNKKKESRPKEENRVDIWTSWKHPISFGPSALGAKELHARPCEDQ